MDKGKMTDLGSRTIRRRTIRRGKFGADNSALDNSARTIRRDNSSRTIRRKIRYQFYRKFRFHSAIFFSSIPLLFQLDYLHQSRFYFSNIIFINPASITAIDLFFSPILFGIRHYELGLLIDEKIVLKWKRD